MQIVIDIPEGLYGSISEYPSRGFAVSQLERAILHGTPLPDNATNGDVIKAVFPNGVTAKFATFMRFVVGEDEYINCAYDWWNAPYQKGGKECR